MAVITRTGYIPSKPDKKNQDIHFTHKDFCGNPNLWFFNVCDGHGLNGHFASAFVKDNLGQSIQNQARFNPGLLVSNERQKKYQMITKAYLQCNRDLNNRSFDVSYSGTTLVSVFLHGRKIVCANVGDSRAVLGSIKKIEEAKKIRDSIRTMKQ